jgi:DNA-binding transcriptional LysR family regulator
MNPVLRVAAEHGLAVRLGGSGDWPIGLARRNKNSAAANRLFSRSRSGLIVSDAGRTFRPHAELLLRTAALVCQGVHGSRPAGGTPLQIAAALSISVYFLPGILKRFQRAHPNVIISIRPGHSKEVLDMVLSEEAEIGLARSLQHREVETKSLRDDPLLLVVHPKRGPKHRDGSGYMTVWIRSWAKPSPTGSMT